MSQPLSKETMATLRAIAVLQAKIDSMSITLRTMRDELDSLMTEAEKNQEVITDQIIQVGQYQFSRDEDGELSMSYRKSMIEIPMDEDQPE